MKAAQIKQYGDASIIEIVDIAKPLPTTGQVVVEVHAASLNPSDTSMREGYFQQTIPLNFPVTLGGDLAGIVVEVGEGVMDLAVGDSVYGQASALLGNSGAFAEYAVVRADQLALAPRGLAFEASAALPLAGVSAVQALVETITITAGQKIFITGGAGGIGTLAIQIAKSIGAYVATTATGDGLVLAKELGADEIFDFKVEDATELLKNYDAVFDTVGGEGFDKAVSILKKGGIAVSMIGTVNQELADKLGVIASTQLTLVTRERLEVLAACVQRGGVKAQIGGQFSLLDIQEAFRVRESGRINGKVILKIGN